MTGPETLAFLLADEFGVTGKPNLEALAGEIGLRIKDVDVDGFEGTLVRALAGPKGIIGINKSIREQGRRRFTIAHEIGHYVIPSHRRLKNVCLTEQLESWNPQLPIPEVEANEFAAELLLPARFVRSALTLHQPSFRRISEVARDFETSLTATTYRFLTLTDMAFAMVWSTNERATWFKRSDGFRYFLPIHELPVKGSFAWRLFQGKSAPEEFHPIDAALWLDRRDAERVDVLFEHSLHLRNYNAVLTLLWAEGDRECSSEEDEVELGELDPYNALERKNWPR